MTNKTLLLPFVVFSSSYLIFYSPSISANEQGDSPQHKTLSFQGYSGLLNVPTADSLANGQFISLYANQLETTNGYRSGSNYHFAVGIWDNLEISGRLADYDNNNENQVTDLSANIKFTVPLIPKDWFQLAIGIQDIGGAANYFDAKYLVASKTVFDDFQFSIGAGQSDSKVGRLDGVFGGVKWQVTDWAALMVEYDAVDTQAGIAVTTPKAMLPFGLQLHASAQIQSSNDELNDELFYSVGFSLPLNHISTSERPAIMPAVHEDMATVSANVDQLKDRLQGHGFQSIRSALLSNNIIYVELENHVFNRNQLDGIGVALAEIALRMKSTATDFVLVMKEREVPVIGLQGNIEHYLQFLRQSAPLALTTLSLQKTNEYGMAAIGNMLNSSWLKPRFTFWPELVTRVGTEYGVLDATLVLASNVELPVWRGGAMTATYHTHLWETADFDEGQIFEQYDLLEGLQEYSLHQTFALPANITNLTSIGRFRKTYNYVSNEMRWQSVDGDHMFSLKAGRYENQEIKPLKPYPNCNILFPTCWPAVEPINRDVVVGTYRYYSPELNTAFELQGGQFWQQDKGAKLIIKRMFDDVTVNLIYKSTKVDGQDNKQHIGLGFTIPLTPKKEYQNQFLQVRGKPQWSHSVTTLINESRNTITPGTADDATHFYNLDDHYFNADRLSLSYIQQHADRLRKALSYL